MCCWAGRLSADKCLCERHPLGDIKKMLPHSHFARSKLFCYKEMSIRLKVTLPEFAE